MKKLLIIFLLLTLFSCSKKVIYQPGFSTGEVKRILVITTEQYGSEIAYNSEIDRVDECYRYSVIKKNQEIRRLVCGGQISMSGFPDLKSAQKFCKHN